MANSKFGHKFTIPKDKVNIQDHIAKMKLEKQNVSAYICDLIEKDINQTVEKDTISKLASDVKEIKSILQDLGKVKIETVAETETLELNDTKKKSLISF